MKDRLRYKGWLVKEKRMVELMALSMFCETARFDDGEPPSGLNLVIPNQIIPMQCTGMKDKNGVLIYEGDKLKAKGGNGYVSWCHNEWSFMKEDACVTLWSIDTERCSIVIGNIYEDEEITPSTPDNCSDDNCKIIDQLDMLNHNVLIIANHLTGRR